MVEIIGVAVVLGLAVWGLSRFQVQEDPPAPPPGAQPIASVPPGDQLTVAQAFALAGQIDRNHFDGWFTKEGRSLADVVAIWQVESDLKPGAKGDLHLADKSWGIGQVRGNTAKDFGVTDPRVMLSADVGAYTSMLYMQWCWKYLRGRFNRPPSMAEWIGSYNAGVGNVADKGYIPQGYLAKWQNRRAGLV